MAYAAVTSLKGTLHLHFLQSQPRLPLKRKQKIVNSLNKNLGFFQEFLEKSEIAYNNSAMKDLEAEMRDIAFEAEEGIEMELSSIYLQSSSTEACLLRLHGIFKQAVKQTDCLKKKLIKIQSEHQCAKGPSILGRMRQRRLLLGSTSSQPADPQSQNNITVSKVSKSASKFDNRMVGCDKEIKTILDNGMSHSYSTHRDKNLPKVDEFSSTNQKLDDRALVLPSTLANQGSIAQLSEQISTLNDRMDDFTSRMEELNSNLSNRRSSPSAPNITQLSETGNGSAPTSHFISSLENGSLTGSIMPHSSSFSHMARDSTLTEELSNIARSQRQIMLQLDNLSTLLRERSGPRLQHKPRTRRHRLISALDPVKVPAISALSVAGLGLGILFFRSFRHRN